MSVVKNIRLSMWTRPKISKTTLRLECNTLFGELPLPLFHLYDVKLPIISSLMENVNI